MEVAPTAASVLGSAASLGLEGSGERRAKPKVVMDRVANGGRQGGKGESLLGAVVRPAAANPNPTL